MLADVLALCHHLVNAVEYLYMYSGYCLLLGLRGTGEVFLFQYIMIGLEPLDPLISVMITSSKGCLLRDEYQMDLFSPFNIASSIGMRLDFEIGRLR